MTGPLSCRKCRHVGLVEAGTKLVCRWEKSFLPPPVFRARLWGADAPTTHEDWANGCNHYEERINMELRAYTNDQGASRPVEELWYDGYHINERLFEGLPIKVTLEGGELKCTAAWPVGYNKAYWMKRARDFAAQHDVFSTTEALDNDDGFISQEAL